MSREKIISLEFSSSDQFYKIEPVKEVKKNKCQQIKNEYKKYFGGYPIPCKDIDGQHVKQKLFLNNTLYWVNKTVKKILSK